MKWRRLIPTLVPLSILWFGFQAILRSFSDEFVPAAELIFLAAILDGVDGEIARLFKGTTMFGARLDTYVDTVCFGVAPAILVYEAMWKDYDVLGQIVVFCIVMSGVVRFSRNPVRQEKTNNHTFRGLPIPVNAIWLCSLIILTKSSLLTDGPFAVDHRLVERVMWPCSFAFLLLQCSNVRYAKPGKDLLVMGLAVPIVCMILTRQPLLGFTLGVVGALFYWSLIHPLFVRLPQEEVEDEESFFSLRRR